jgi:hypothetical protein
MSDKTILIVVMDKRRASALRAQEAMTDFGCIVKTRLGIHDGVMDKCSDHGIIILELVGKKSERQQLKRRLSALAGVKTKSVDV